MELYKIEDLVEGIFISRPNRYIAEVLIEGNVEVVHVHDPGRLKELLFPQNRVLVKHMPGEKRKTKWDMIAAQKGDAFVLVHSGIHRYIAEALLKNETLNPFGVFTKMKPEATYGKSRIDFFATVTEKDGADSEIWVEVKGCSLSIDGVAQFPDAPTVRGTRHLEELISIKKSGARAGVLLLVLSESHVFVPKRDTDPKFYEAFYRALDSGVEIYPVKVILKPTGALEYRGLVPIKEVENE